MSVPSPYLHGFLAAARPVDRVAGNALPPSTPPAQEADASSVEAETTQRPDPLDCLPRLLEGALANRPPDAEDRWRFQWFGLFYEAPAQDAFRLRLRLPGGRLRPFQLAGLAEITQRFAGGQIVLNAQGGLDVPGVPTAWSCRVLSETEDIGLSARRTGGNCVQAVRGGECERPDLGERQPTVYPLVRALEQAVTLGPAFADLPRPCEIVFRSGGETVLDPVVDTMVLQEVGDETASPGQDPRSAAEAGFVLTVPGGGGDGFLLAPDKVVPGCLSLLEAWRACDHRSGGANTALAEFLGGLGPGAAGVLLGGARQVASAHKTRASACPAPPGLAVPGARLLSGQLAALERCCREHGWREVRLAHGRLHAVANDGTWVEATAAMARAFLD